MTADSIDTRNLFERARAGDQEAIGDLLRSHRARLLNMVRTRLNPRIRGRVDESDVVQEAFLEAAQRLPEYLAGPRTPFFLWLRQILGHKIVDAHRRHLGAQVRNAEREISLDTGGRPIATSLCLAAQLLGQLTSPSQAMIRAETRVALQEAINAMEPLDREILALRHFEELSNQEAAQELGIEPAAASKRFVRALQRLQCILQDLGLVEVTS
jgi:RNA polymerase sigma-70 factor (ECF subfamily)